MFKAIIKDKSANPSAKGTLSALWSTKTQSKLGGGDGQPDPQPAEALVVAAGKAAADTERTPEPAPRQDERPLSAGELAGAADSTPAAEAQQQENGAEVINVMDEPKPQEAAKKARVH